MLIRTKIVDQLDLHDLRYTRTHTQRKCVPRMPSTTTTTLNTGTFTFTEPNRAQGNEEQQRSTAHRREKPKERMRKERSNAQTLHCAVVFKNVKKLL